MANLAVPAALLVATVALVPIAALSAPSVKSLYSEAQATEGATLYAQRCAMCHGKTLEGTWEIPTLKGRFLNNWNHAPVARLFDYVSKAMPQMAPGSLTPDQNAKIVAYILKENGAPAGATALPTDTAAMGNATIEVK